MNRIIVILAIFFLPIVTLGQTYKTVTTPSTSTPVDDDVLQRKAGNWVPRSMVQLKTDLSLSSYMLYADTAMTLLPYRNGLLARLMYTDTASMLSAYIASLNTKLKYTDTTATLSTYQTAINNRLRIADTSTMLSPYISLIGQRVKYSDTASMFTAYRALIDGKVRYADTASMLSAYITSLNTKIKYSDSATMLAAYRNKLAGIALGATANQTDAFLLARANHTGTQLSSTISDFATAALTPSIDVPDNSGIEPSNQHKFLMGNFYKKQYTKQTGPAQTKWLSFGDSYAGIIYGQVGEILKVATGGNNVGSYFSGNYNGVTNNGTAGSVTDNTTDFPSWPTGLTTSFTSGGSRTYGVGGSTTYATKIKVYYVKESGAGTFNVQVNGVDNVTGISAAGTLGTLGITTITQARTLSTVTVVNQTGTIKIIGVGFEDTTASGLISITVGQGGIALSSATSTSLTNFSSFLTDVAPDVFTLEMKEDSSFFATALSTFFTAINTSLSNTDVVLIGTTPVLTGDGNQVAQNKQLETAARTFGYKYYDTYKLFGSYAKLVSLGWQGDGTHVATQANQYRGNLMLRDLGIINQFKGTSPYSIENDSTLTKDLRIGINLHGAINFRITGDNAFGLDATIATNRDLTLTGRRIYFSQTDSSIFAGPFRFASSGVFNATSYTFGNTASNNGITVSRITTNPSAVTIAANSNNPDFLWATNQGTSGSFPFRVGSNTNFTLKGNGDVQFPNKVYHGGASTPNALVHIGPGVAAGNGGQIKLAQGLKQSTPEDGAINYDTTSSARDLTFDVGATHFIIARTLQASATLDFASTAAQNSTDLAITVTGAALNDEVSIGAPDGAVLANSSFSAWVSATNTVKVRFNNYSSISQDPSSGTFRVSVIKH